MLRKRHDLTKNTLQLFFAVKQLDQSFGIQEFFEFGRLNVRHSFGRGSGDGFWGRRLFFFLLSSQSREFVEQVESKVSTQNGSRN